MDESAVYGNLLKLLNNATPVKSGFQVAAIMFDSQGDWHGGCNIEEEGDITSGTCAERTAIANMIAKKGAEAKIEKVYILGRAPNGKEVSASPCGKCRELINSYAKDQNIIVSTLGKNGIIEQWTLADLLPSMPESGKEKKLTFGSPKDSKEIRTLLRKGIDAAYAPYSQEKTAVVILGENNKRYLGCVVENAAYPSGTNAVSAALSAMVVDGCQKIKSIYIRTVDKNGNDIIRFPSGNSRQQLREFSNPDKVKINIVVENRIVAAATLSQMLKSSFGPDHLSGDNEIIKKGIILKQQKHL